VISKVSAIDFMRATPYPKRATLNSLSCHLRPHSAPLSFGGAVPFGEGLFASALRGRPRVLSAFLLGANRFMTKSWEKSDWVESYRNAMLSSPVDKAQIEAAKLAITERISSLLHAPGSKEEMHALKQSYEDLLLLERESA
jgi:hypothetical protein